MRITIIQSEIEEAIRNHILSQITVQEGMAIDIDLKATRGDEGFQAFIDIRPDTATQPDPEKVEPIAPKAEKPLAIEETVTKAKAGRGSKTSTAKAEPAPETATAVAEPEPEAAGETSGEADASPDAETEAPKVSSIFGGKQADKEPATEPAPQSIFGGLKRPVNA